MMQSLYDTLQVRRDANEQQIRKAYYKLSLVLHPDKCLVMNTTEAFQRLHHAYEILCDPDRRSEYDRKLQGCSKSCIGGSCLSRDNNFALDQDIWLRRSEALPFEEILYNEDHVAAFCRCGTMVQLQKSGLYDGIVVVQCNGCSLYLNFEAAAQRSKLYNIEIQEDDV